jgi:hypothetical protein
MQFVWPNNGGTLAVKRGEWIVELCEGTVELFSEQAFRATFQVQQ